MASFPKYAGVGVLSFATNLSITAMLHELLGVPAELAFAAALATVIALNYILARRFIYSSSGPVLTELSRFLGATAGFRIMEYVMFLAFHSLLGINYLVSIMLLTSISFVSKYFAYKHLVFNGSDQISRDGGSE
jgi:putative flippase GtrA